MRVLRAEYLTGAASVDRFPVATAPEVAFLGRSNVGKSSLLNRLVRRKKLAQTSSTPGKTRLIHWYQVVGEHRELHFVDLPGYGYAKVAKKERQKWKPLVERYLERGPMLRAAVLLQDLRRDLTEDEELLLQWLEEREIPSLVALTKCDKLRPMQRGKRRRVLLEQVPLPKERVFATSAEAGFGIPELWGAIDRLVDDRPQAATDGA